MWKWNKRESRIDPGDLECGNINSNDDARDDKMKTERKARIHICKHIGNNRNVVAKRDERRYEFIFIKWELEWIGSV